VQPVENFLFAEMMFKSIYLLNFCMECTLEVLPAFGIAWLLGCLFWWVFRGQGHQKLNVQLKEDLKASQQKAIALENKLNTIHFNWESIGAELNSLRNNYRELEIRYKALESYKGTSASIIYEPVPPPQSLIQELGKEELHGKRVIYFSSEKTDKDTPEVVREKKIIQLDKASGRAFSYNNAFSPSDLTIIEGIGQKLEALLKENGISTWTRLAVTSVADLRALLTKSGSRYIVHDPSAWPQQAALARVGQWEELIRLQQALNPAGRSKVKRQYKKLTGAAAFRVDDLKVIEGIGPKIEQLLKDGGIDNWWKLATATIDDIEQILSAAGNSYSLADPKTWPQQARLAAEEKWEELKAWQEQLKGGKEY
jgi:predicted flap endonuclease-1-like 5' DNA nuclease